jgi:hypothetical protein
LGGRNETSVAGKVVEAVATLPDTVGPLAGAVLVAVKQHLGKALAITHSTVEIDPEGNCADHAGDGRGRPGC